MPPKKVTRSKSKEIEKKPSASKNERSKTPTRVKASKVEVK